MGLTVMPMFAPRYKSENALCLSAGMAISASMASMTKGYDMSAARMMKTTVAFPMCREQGAQQIEQRPGGGTGYQSLFPAQPSHRTLPPRPRRALLGHRQHGHHAPGVGLGHMPSFWVRISVSSGMMKKPSAVQAFCRKQIIYFAREPSVAEKQRPLTHCPP